MPHTPDDERPARAVPEAAEEENGDEIAIPARRADTVAAEETDSEPAVQLTPIPREAFRSRAPVVAKQANTDSAGQLPTVAETKISTTLEQEPDFSDFEPSPVVAGQEPSKPAELAASSNRPSKLGLPSPVPKLDRELSGRARVDQISDEAEVGANPDNLALTPLETAEVSESKAAPNLLSAQRDPAAAAAELEPVIRPARRSPLPEPQVVANRPLELPAPEGWSAATKLNAARRAAQAQAAALGRQTDSAEPL